MATIPPQYQYRRFLHPRYWPTWILVGTLRLIAFLPHNGKQRLGTWLGLLTYKLAGKRRHIAETNIRACFPEKTPEEQRELVKDTFIATSKGYVESTIAWWGNIQPYVDHLQVYGLEHLREAERRGKGVLLLGGHFSILDFAGPLANSVFNFNYMFRPNNNRLFNAMIERGRLNFSGHAFTKKQLHDMIAFMQEGHVVWYGCDQDFGRRNSVFAPFFGIQTATLTTPTWIARKSNATVLQISQLRHEGKTYSIHFSPIYESFAELDDAAAAALMNQELERVIRLAPEQYLWVHRRFKTRPEGEPKFY
ncbi:lipid A biosynthesis acyltransferase [Marinobacteraceae bacterium S3BR75-40.1]